jgi:hypothetical protein
MRTGTGTLREGRSSRLRCWTTRWVDFEEFDHFSTYSMSTLCRPATYWAALLPFERRHVA